MNTKSSHLIGIDCRLWNETGVGRYIRNLVWELAKIDKKNSYTLFFRENEFNNVELPGDNFQKRLADIRWHSVEEQLKFSKILEKENLDLLHFPYFSVPISYNRPFVVTIHDLIINHYPTGKASTHGRLKYLVKLFAYKYVVRSAIKRAKKIIAVSEATKKEIVNLYHTVPGKIVVTLEGVDEKITKFQGKKTSIKNPYLLYVGNAYPHKNLERLLEAFSLFKEHDKKGVILVLVGKEDFFYKRLKKIISPGLSDSILFYEKVSDGGLASLYHNAKALIIPSLMEGFGLPAVEAMANECLVLAANIPSLVEVCKNAAFYFNPFSPTDIKRAIEDLFSKSPTDLLEKKKAGNKVVKLYSLQTMAAQTLAVYESCIGV